MSASLLVNNKRIDFTEFEWQLLKKQIIKDTLLFWEEVAADVDGGLLPPELALDNEMIDRNVLFTLKTKLMPFLEE
jgi:hypothetical protein